MTGRCGATVTTSGANPRRTLGLGVVKSVRRAVGGWWWPGARFVVRMGRGALAESLYLLTAPVTAAAGLLLVLGGLWVAAAGLVVPGGSPVAGVAAPVRWVADVEWWRIVRVSSSAAGAQRAGWVSRPRGTAAASDPGLWLGLVHTVVVLPVALVTSVVTALWWFVGVGAATTAVRNWGASAGPLRPLTLSAGDPQSHIDVSLGLTAPTERLAFGTVFGLLVLLSLPVVTRVGVAVQAGLGRALLSDGSAFRRRIRGLEQERDTARAQTVAAVTAEAVALRRLERDIHDGPQQRLVRLALELGRAQRHLDSRPEAVREALTDAIVQAEEALDELRALSRGIAPPILVDRGLGEALADLAVRSTIPAVLDAHPLGRRLDIAVETAAYFVIAEALTNVAKHSNANRCVIGLRHSAGTLRLWVMDDGVGGAAPGKGHGLRGLADRVYAIGGQLQVTSPAGGPTTIAAELPCR